MNDGDTVPHWRQIAPGIYQVDGLIHWPVFPSRSVRDPRQELADSLTES